jgi:hypothetical protein
MNSLPQSRHALRLKVNAVLPRAMSVKRCRTVRADDLEVVQAVVRSVAIGVVENQTHPASPPDLSLATKLATTLLHTLVIEALLEAPAAVQRPADKDLLKRDTPSDRAASRPVGVEMICGNPM